MFNPETALNLAKKYAQPRLVGTTRNDEGADDIGQFLLRCGYKVTYPKFNFTSALGTFITAELLIGAVLIITAIWIRESSVLLSVYKGGRASRYVQAIVLGRYEGLPPTIT